MRSACAAVFMIRLDQTGRWPQRIDKIQRSYRCDVYAVPRKANRRLRSISRELDCDLRRSELTRILAPDVESRMSEVVAGAVSLKEAKGRDELTELMFLPAGPLPPCAPERNFRVRSELDDWVVADLPPIGPVPDAQSTTQLLPPISLSLNRAKPTSQPRSARWRSLSMRPPPTRGRSRQRIQRFPSSRSIFSAYNKTWTCFIPQ